MDAKRCRGNGLVEVITPIQPQSAEAASGMIEQRSRGMAKLGARGVGPAVDDQSDAYKSLLVSEQSRKAGAASIWNEEKQELEVYFARSLFLGSEAAVLSYDSFSVLIRSILRRICGVPCVCVIDDFMMAVKAGLEREIALLISEIFAELRVVFNPPKTRHGRRVDWCGVDYDCSLAGRLKLRLTERRRLALLNQFDTALGSGEMSMQELQKLTGRLEAVSLIMRGRTGRPFLAPLHAKLGAGVYDRRIGERMRRAMLWWQKIVVKEKTMAEWDLLQSRERRVVVWTGATRTGRGMFFAYVGKEGSEAIQCGWVEEDE